MKIAHIFWSFTIGGAETMLVDIVNKQIDEGNDVLLVVINSVCSQDLLSEIDSRVSINLIRRQPGSKNPGHFIKLNRTLIHYDPDIVHCHNYNISRFILPRFYRKSILTVHGFRRPITENNKYAVVVAISQAVFEELRLKGLRNIELVRNGVDDSEINRKHFYNSVIQLVCIGRLEHNIKGQDILIKAFNLLLKEVSDVKLNFIGEGSSKLHLVQMVKDLNLENHICFHGLLSRKEIYKRLNNYDVLIQPSLEEGFGLTAVEAMIARVPLIISSAKGLMEVTFNGKYAQYTISDSGPDSYANALESLIEKIKNSSATLNEFILNTEKYAAKNFSIKTTVNEYFKLYSKILVVNEKICNSDD